MKRGSTKTEIRMFSNGKARILRNTSRENRESFEFLVSVFSDFYRDYLDSVRTKPKEIRKHYSILAKTSERIDLTERGGAILERASDKASAITDRLANLLTRAMLPFKNLQLFKVAGSPERSLMSIAAYVKAIYSTIYKMVEGQVPDPHAVALAAAKVAANFIITIKTAIIVSSLSDEEVNQAAAEAGITGAEEQIEEPITGEESIAPDLREQVNALVNKYRIAYKMLGITKIIPNVTQNIRKIVFATLATQYPELNISPTIYSVGAFAYNEMINKLVDHILGGVSQVAQSKKPRRFSAPIGNELGIQEGDHVTTKLAPVYEDDGDDYDDDDDDDEFDTDYDDYDEVDDEDEFIHVGDVSEGPVYETTSEVTEEDLEEAIASIEVSPQSKRLARKFAEENPEGFRDYDELKAKLYSFLIRHLFRFRFYSESEESDEIKEQVADVVDRLDKIEEKLTSLEEAVEKVIEASTTVAESEEDTTEEEDEAFDLFLEKDKDESEEKDTDQSEDSEEAGESEESEDSSEDEGGDENESEKTDEEDEEEKAQSKRKKSFSEESRRRRLSEMLENDEYDEYFSRKLKHKMPKKAAEKSEKRLSERREAKNKEYAARKYKLQDIDVVSIIHKLQKPKFRKNKRSK